MKNKGEKKKLKKLNFRNFKTGSVAFMIILSIFRIAMIVFWLIAPIILAFTIAFDDGIRNLVLFIWDLILGSDGNATQATVITINTVAPIMWFLTLLIMLGATVKPFFNRRTYLQRLYLGFNYIFWPVLFISIIYGIYYTIPFYGKPGGSITDPESAAWQALRASFTPFSGWMIALQCMYFVLIIFGIFSFFEAIMVKKMKLDYSDFVVREANQRSLVNQVIEGKIEFGDFNPDEVDKELKRIRKEEIAEEKRLKFEAMQKAEEERIEKKNAKKQRKNKKGNKNKEES
ncbi:hypothetical protein [Spiroplasma monobiae]|uniref:Transmembrane protein n=1 Tax=Spiroplasma monobiae MQ-1 TaxID=1336748 RepID=A0A2K9LTT5_SPISQ|nr:hypothetical protein [Spiroplasma monobiae]AUM62420.1 hypothetical protein SMONO_v1c01690 [Spiroplasma monobiae MQ-1]